jgi:PAS domain S-box-containing protein
MTTPTTLPEALTEIEGLRGQVRELLRLLGQEAPLNTGAAGLSTSEIAGLNGMPEISLAQVSLERQQTGRERTQIVAEGRNVIEIAPDIIFKLDLHGNLAGWNKRLETVTGFVPEELNSRPAVSFAPECEREQTAAAIRQAFEQGYTELEGHLLTKAGRMIPYHWTGATLENHLGHVIGLIGVGRDRTVLKHAEEALRTSEARFRELVETTTDWMWEINELGAYTYCSPKIREFLGYEPDEAIGKTPFDFMPPEEAHRVAALFGPIAAARKPFAGIENINRRKDGQLVTFECRGIPIFGADGSFRGYRGFDQDVTRRKWFELQNRERLDSMIRFQEIQLHLHRQPFQDLTEGLRTILRMAANALSIERVGIWLFNDDHSSLICRELYQLSLNKYESGAVLDASRYPRYFDALDQSLPLAVNDVLTDPRTSEFIEDYFIPLGISSVMDMAVRRDGTIIGVVWFEHIGLKTEWSEEEQAFARSIGDHVALCLLDAERQQTEMTLRESEERFAAAVEGATDVLWDAQRIPGVPWHAPETPIWWSPRVRQLLGLEDGESFDTLGQWVARLHPEDMDRVLSQLTAHIEHRVSYDVEYRLRTNHGEYRWMRGKGQAIWDEQGEPRRMSGSCQDISERKRAESALQESESHFRAMIENSSDIITVLDLDGTIRFESPSFERLLGYAQHEIDGRIAFDFIHPDDLPAVIEKFQRIVQQPGETQTAEFRFRHQDGSWLILEGVGRATCDARSRSCVIVNSRDITERKRAEAALRISQERYARATAVGKVGVWELDVATGSYHGDVNLKALFGYGEDELSTDPYVWLNLVHPDDRSIAMAHWQRVVRGEADGYNYELRMVKKDGTVIWTDVRGHAVRSNEGQVKHLFGATVDITERKRTEQALREREGSLARFKATLDQVHDCVFMFSADSLHFVYCNRGAVMQVGYTEDELLTMKPLDIKPEFTERAFREMLEPLRDGSCAVQVFETVHRHKDGHDVAVEVSLQFVAEAGQAGLFAAVVRDITERKHAQEALRLSEERFRSLFENSPIAYQSLDREGRFLDVNQRLCHLLGYEREVLLGSDFGDLWAGNVDGDFSATFEVFKKSGKVRNELALRRRDGTIVNAVIDGRIQRDQKGEFIRTHCILTDITERAQAEEALRRSEARLKEAQRIAHIGSWELDLVANRLTWSDEIYRIFEIDAEAFGASYEAFLQLVHPDDRSLVDRAYTESVTFRTPYNITHRLLMADGRIKFVREQCETQYGRDGLALRSSGTVQDITKQKEAEEALAQHHTLLTAIMDASIDLISIKDLQGRYVHINRAGADAVGMPAEAVIGWDDVALWGGGLAASRRASDRFVTESGQTITVEEQGTLLGNIAHYLTTKAPYRDSEGSIIGVIGIARNITEWKRVEEDRQKALTLLINVINATPDLIFVKDRDLRTLLCNNSFAQALGKTPEDLIGRSDIENGWSPELVKGNSDAGFLGYELDDRQALAGKVVHNSSDPVNVNGEVRIFDTYKVPLRDEAGGVIGILGVSRDVTERKRMEEILRQRERDLRAAVEERERISEDLHDGILQSIFAVGLGLESCRTLVSELPLPRKKTTAPLMTALNRAIGHLNHIMAEVRNFIAGIESHVLQGGDVGSTLRAMVQAMCESNGTAWRVTIEEAAVRELSTEQAYHVMNIVREALSNSLRHSGAWRIALSLKRLRRSVRLSVTDNGKGFIPDSVHDVGHGLANMAARARKLGVRIEVHSRPRKGTKVLLDIPRRPVDE